MPVIHSTKGDSSTHHTKVKGVLHLEGGKRDETPLAFCLVGAPKSRPKPVLFKASSRQGSAESARHRSNARDTKLEEAEEAEDLQVWPKHQWKAKLAGPCAGRFRCYVWQCSGPTHMRTSALAHVVRVRPPVGVVWRPLLSPKVIIVPVWACREHRRRCSKPSPRLPPEYLF
jgi:hypothetical protein